MLVIAEIVIHYTAGVYSYPGCAWNTAEWFKDPNAGGSADFIVDDGTVVQYNPNPSDYYTWAVGGGKYSSMTTSRGGKYYGKCKNTNSISVEICSNKTNKKSLADLDSDWYFTEKTLDNASKLVQDLMKKYNIKIENVIMHHDVTGKHCPSMWVRNESALKGWYDFIARVKGQIQPNIPDIIDTTCNISINGITKEYKSKNVKGNNYVAARPFLEDLGYTVGFNDMKKRVTVDNRLTLDINTIIDNGSSFIHLRETIDFLNKYDDFHFPQDKTIRWIPESSTIVIS